MKTVTVIVSGVPGNNVRDAQITPDITANDLLRAIGLTGYLLSLEGGGNHVFAGDELLYDQFPESGGKARATPLSEVGF
jgi:hypothetical protein